MKDVWFYYTSVNEPLHTLNRRQRHTQGWEKLLQRYSTGALTPNKTKNKVQWSMNNFISLSKWSSLYNLSSAYLCKKS